MPSSRRQEYDVLVVGAGLSGLSSLYNVHKRFPLWTVKVLEAAQNVGGTWYWNYCPGARFDSESISYQLSWDKEFLQQWDWSETFAAQGKILRYIRAFAEKNDQDKDIQFNTTIDSARWLDDERSWLFADLDGYEYQGRFFITCLGILSNPALSNIHGLKKFFGQAFHTSRFPRDLDVSRDLAGKRVGVIGTGATGIQNLTAIAQRSNAKSLSVFQRTATWAAPLRNKPVSREEMDAHKANYDDIFKRCALTSGCVLHQPDPRKSNEVTAEERLVLWDKLYGEPGFGRWMDVFKDTYTNREANKLYSDYMAEKISSRVDDSVIAEKLIPKDHGFGLRRVPLESGHYEIFN